MSVHSSTLERIFRTGRVAVPEKRTYNPIWKLLKQTHIVKVKCALHNKETVKKAITKEKDLDIAYKLLTQEPPLQPVELRFKYDIKTWILTVRLVPAKKQYAKLPI